MPWSVFPGKRLKDIICTLQVEKPRLRKIVISYLCLNLHRGLLKSISPYDLGFSQAEPFSIGLILFHTRESTQSEFGKGYMEIKWWENCCWENDMFRIGSQRAIIPVIAKFCIFVFVFPLCSPCFNVCRWLELTPSFYCFPFMCKVSRSDLKIPNET